MMTRYRNPLNAILVIWIISILIEFCAPFFATESEYLKDVKNLKTQVESLKSNLSKKQAEQSISETEYSKVNDKIILLDTEISLIIQSQQEEMTLHWYSNFVAPLCSLIVAVFGLTIVNKVEQDEELNS